MNFIGGYEQKVPKRHDKVDWDRKMPYTNAFFKKKDYRRVLKKFKDAIM